MSSSIHYKFRTTNVSKTLSFDGTSIKVPDLKRAICAAENIRAEFGDDEIPRNSSVTVQRVPLENGVKLPKISNPEITAATQPAGFIPDNATHIKQEDFSKMTEEERIKHITIQSTFKYASNNYYRKPASNTQHQAPPDYLCNKCNQHGHFPKACPLLNIRKTTGIPNEELMETTADDPQAMLHPSGKFMIPIMHYKAREERKLREERRRQGIVDPLENHKPKPMEKKELPDELKCPICKDIFKEALVTACCGETFCGDCIQQVMSDALAADLTPECPSCKKPIGANALFPNNSLRESVDKYKKSLIAPVIIQDEVTQSPKMDIDMEDNTGKTEEANTVTEEEKPIVVPTVNLSAMLAAQNPPVVVKPEPLLDFSKPPPKAPSPSVVVDFSKPPPNFTFSQPPPTLLSNSSPVYVEPYKLRKPSPLEPRYDEKDEEAINNAWEKLNVDDEMLDLATLLEKKPASPLKSIEKVDEREHSSKEKRSKHRSRSRDQSHRSSRRSSSKSRKRRDDKERESRKRTKDRNDRHKSSEKRSKEHRSRDKEKERRKSVERSSHDRENHRRNDEDEKKLAKPEQRDDGREKEKASKSQSKDTRKEANQEKKETSAVKEEIQKATSPKVEESIKNKSHKLDTSDQEVKSDKPSKSSRKYENREKKQPSESKDKSHNSPLPKKSEKDTERKKTFPEAETERNREPVPKKNKKEEAPTKKESPKEDPLKAVFPEYQEVVKDLLDISIKTPAESHRPNHSESEKEDEKLKKSEKEKLKKKDSSKHKEKKRSRTKEREKSEKAEKKKSSRKDKSEDRERDKKKSSSREKKKLKSEEKKKKKHRKSSDRSDVDDDEEPRRKRRNKEKKHKKDRKRQRDYTDDNESDVERKRRRKS